MKDFFKADGGIDIPPFLLLRRTNEAGVALIKEYEGLRLKAYRCPSQVWTIGYGHTRTVRPGMVITEEEADDLLKDDLRKCERAVSSALKVDVSDNQYAALVSFTFNVGSGNLKSSTLLRLLNRGWFEQVPVQLLRWNKSKGEALGGLNRRRAAEGQLWQKEEF